MLNSVMYPWRESLKSWADSTHLHVDALGLITLLGADEMNRIIGRLVPSPYLDYLPLLGAFVVAGNGFVTKNTGFIMYNISAGIETTELAGWFSRWLQTQDLHKVRSVVTWQVSRRPPQWKALLIGFTLIAFPIFSILVIMTALSADWWGFANVVAMMFSVLVKCFLVAQNQAGIDENIRKAETEAIEYNFSEKHAKYREEVARLEALHQTDRTPFTENMPIEPNDPHRMAKVIVITDESKAVTIASPEYLIRRVFATTPRIPNPRMYIAFRYIGWAAFAVQVISIGMSALYTQICTVVLILLSTILTGNKIGCDDSQFGRAIWDALVRNEKDDYTYSCWVSSNLKATVSSYPAEYSDWSEDSSPISTVQVTIQKGTDENYPLNVSNSAAKVGQTSSKIRGPKDIPERRQDLYAWLNLTNEEDTHLVAWGMIPRSQEWMKEYIKKKEIHRKRLERALSKAIIEPINHSSV